MKKNKFPPLDEVTKPILTTDEAAYYLNRKAQTLRTWSCKKKGIVKPIYIQRRLGWKTAEIKNLLGV